MFTINDARCTNQLETANKQRINKFHQNGFTSTSLSAKVTGVSNFVEENVFLFYIVKAPHPGAFSHSLPNTSNMSIAISKQYKPEMNLQYIYRKFLPTRYQVENPGKCLLKFDALQIVIKEMDKRVYQTFLF